MFETVRSYEQGQSGTTDANCLFENLLEFGRFEETQPARKTQARGRCTLLGLACGNGGQCSRLGGQPGTALGATRTEDLAAANSTHAGTEAMGTGAFDTAGLESAFHKSLSQAK